MERRSLLKRMGIVSLAGGLAGCTGGSNDDASNTPSESTEASFSGNWGLPACSDNEDARVVIQDYNPEQGVGQIYNRTNTNLYVSVMNEAGSTAESNQGDYDIYVPLALVNRWTASASTVRTSGMKREIADAYVEDLPLHEQSGPVS